MIAPSIDRAHSAPAYRQIVDWARDAIASGEIDEGGRLPAERTLAAELGVSRNTVVRAYEELAADGLVIRHVGVGTIVRAMSADETDVGDPLFWRAMFLQQGAAPRVTVRELIANVAGNEIALDEVAAPVELFPAEPFRALVDEAITTLGGELLAYTDTEGLPSLRQAILERSPAPAASGVQRSVAVTNGATQGLSLLLSALVGPGDIVAIESPTFPCALTALSATGAQIVGVPVGAEGLRLDLLEQLLRRQSVKLLITVPNFNNPTGVLQPLEAKHELLAITRRHGVAVIADDVFGDLAFAPGDRPPSLIDLEGSEHVLEVNSLSKVFGGGLRVGWVLGPRPVVERVAELKCATDINTSTFLQHVADRVLRSGLLDEQIAEARPYHRERATWMYEALREVCGDSVQVVVPEGGMSLWCELRTGHTARELLTATHDQSLSFATGDALSADGQGVRHFRLALGSLTAPLAREVAVRLRSAIDTLEERQPRTAMRRSGTRALI